MLRLHTYMQSTPPERFLFYKVSCFLGKFRAVNIGDKIGAGRDLDLLRTVMFYSGCMASGLVLGGGRVQPPQLHARPTAGRPPHLVYIYIYMYI